MCVTVTNPTRKLIRHLQAQLTVDRKAQRLFDMSITIEVIAQAGRSLKVINPTPTGPNKGKKGKKKRMRKSVEHLVPM